MKKLLHMWRYPRMVAWYLVATALFLLVRLPFARVPVIPFYVEFQPGVVLVPLAGVFWGPAGALGVFTASLVGDRLFGMWGVLSVYRAVGLFLYAYSAKYLWDYAMHHIGKQGGLTPHWGRTVRFLYVSLPGCCIAAAWPALGADLFRLYPFPYVTLLLLLNNIIFTVVFGPALYRILARELVPHFGCWREVMSEHPSLPLTKRAARLHVTGAVGACLVGWLIGGAVYGMWPLQRYFIGDSTGPLLVAGIMPFLIFQVLGPLLPRLKPEAATGSGPGGNDALRKMGTGILR